MGTSRKRSGGGGGGGEAVVTTKETLVKVTRERFSVAHNFIDEDDFEDIAGMPAWGENTKRAFLNFGADDDGDAGTAQWARVEKEEFDAWVVADAAASPSATTGMHFRDFTSNSPTAITTTTRDFFIGKDADDKFIIASSTVNEDASPLTVIFENEEEVDVVTGVTGDVADGGGGSDASGYIARKDEYTADDLGKRVWENGVDKIIVLEAHAGHSRVVEFQTLANAVSALDADGNNIATGGAGNFLGFFPNLSGIPALSIADEVWVALIGAGDFEIQDPTGFYASEHWNSYNPFRGAGDRPWATITKADATTQDHVPFTDPDTGVISDWRIVNTTGHAERFTTAVGEAFFIQDEQKIKMVTAYTPHLEGEVQYVSEPYYAPGTNRPLVRFWGVGQTSAENGAIPVAHNATATISTNVFAYRYQFKGESPDESIIGDIPTDLKFLAVADLPVGYFQLITAGTVDEAALLDYQILQLPPGSWRLNFFASHRETADTTLACWLYEAAGTADDTVKAHRTLAYSSVVDDPLGAISDTNRLAMNVKFNDIIIINTETEYLTFITTGFGDAAAGIAGISHLTLEKLL